ncbi:MAG TPA: hypothetical protein PKI03_36305, partial [Pseudomonadota bacterium]|nr:hypothetical protein [Pseudomonadota bacterium]
MENTDAIPIRTLFGQTIDTLAELVEKRPAKERAAIHRAIATLRASQAHAEAMQGERRDAPAESSLDLQPRLAA